MKIKYNQKEKQLVISDGLKSSLFLSRFLMILTLINSVLFFGKGYRAGADSLMIIWSAIGVTVLILWRLFYFKKTSLEKIPLHMIVLLKDQNLIGQKRYSLLLKNGKQRDLKWLKSAIEVQSLKMILAEKGV